MRSTPALTDQLLLAADFDLATPRDDWELLLARLRQLGANTAAVRLAGGWHTPTPAAAERLAALAQLCGRLGLWLMLIPGPPPPDQSPADCAAVLAALLPLQHPAGPVAAIEIGPADEPLVAALRAAGWVVPLCHAMLGEEDRLGPQLRAGGPLDETWPPAALATYVSAAHWWPRLALPAGQRYAPPLSAAQDFALAAPLLGGLTALRISPAIQPASPWHTASAAPIRADGSVRLRLWHARVPLLLLGAAGADLAAARCPADLALGYRQADDPAAHGLAQRLVEAGLSFDLLDLAGQPDRARYRLVADPADLPAAISGAQIGEQVEQAGGIARYAWADAPAVDVALRHGAAYTYLLIANRRPTVYAGLLGYRDPNGDILHHHLRLGPLRVGLVLLREDEVVGAAFGGDGAQGGWLARGAKTSMVFNNGAGAVVPCGPGLLLTAPQSGQFQIRRPEGWHGLALYRLLLAGALLPAAFQTEEHHLIVPYTAEDERGPTDLYLLLPGDAPAPPFARAHLATLLLARAASLLRAARLGPDGLPAAATLLLAGRELVALAEQELTPEAYRQAWQRADDQIRPALAELALAQAAAAPPQATQLARMIGVVMRWGPDDDGR